MLAFLKSRLTGILLFFPCLLVVYIAWSLTPDPSGMGTHQQLGLYECGFLKIFQIPCPMCGMTTTFSHLAHFQFVKGFVNQPFGIVLYAMNLFLIYLGLLELISPKDRHIDVVRAIEKRENIWDLDIGHCFFNFRFF